MRVRKRKEMSPKQSQPGKTEYFSSPLNDCNLSQKRVFHRRLGGGMIHRRQRSLRIDAARRQHDHDFFWLGHKADDLALLAIPEGAAYAQDVVDPRLEYRGDAKIVH